MTDPTISPVGSAFGGEPSPTETPPALQTQILSTEHWSLLASRQLAWTEVFTRAGIFLHTISGAMVALALVAQVGDFGEEFRLFALTILPVVLLVGLGTHLRLGDSMHHDAICVIGMNRIRAAYLRLAPEIEPYLVMSPHDDVRGVQQTMALQSGQPFLVQMLSSTPLLVIILNGMIAGTISVLVALQIGLAISIALGLGGATLAALTALLLWRNGRRVTQMQADLVPMFPSVPVS